MVQDFHTWECLARIYAQVDTTIMEGMSIVVYNQWKK